MNKPQQETLFGHPVGLDTLFFAEIWERFSYYGMHALLIFDMTKFDGSVGMAREYVSVCGEVFGQIAVAAAVWALICFLLVPLLNKWMHEEAPDHLDEKPAA